MYANYSLHQLTGASIYTERQSKHPLCQKQNTRHLFIAYNVRIKFGKNCFQLEDLNSILIWRPVWLLNDKIFFYHVCNLMQPKAGVSAALSLSAVLQDERRDWKRPQFGTATKRVKSNATPVIIKLVNNNPYKLILLQNLFKIGDLDTYNFFVCHLFCFKWLFVKKKWSERVF